MRQHVKKRHDVLVWYFRYKGDYVFEKPSVMKAAEYASVIGSVMPIADRPVPEELAELLGWQEPPVLELIAEHLSQVSSKSAIPRKQETLKQN